MIPSCTATVHGQQGMRIIVVNCRVVGWTALHLAADYTGRFDVLIYASDHIVRNQLKVANKLYVAVPVAEKQNAQQRVKTMVEIIDRSTMSSSDAAAALKSSRTRAAPPHLRTCSTTRPRIVIQRADSSQSHSVYDIAR